MKVKKGQLVTGILLLILGGLLLFAASRVDSAEVVTVESVVRGWEGWKPRAYSLPRETSVGYGIKLADVSQAGLTQVSQRLQHTSLSRGTQVLTPAEGTGLLRQAIAKKTQAAQRELSSLHRYPVIVQAAIVDGFYRGDLSGSPKTLALIRQSRWKAASVELLNNQEYRRAAKQGMLGVKLRMDWRARVFASQEGEHQ